MKILITGVAGFIGSNLADRLLFHGHHVVGIDNYSHGCFDNIKDIWDNEKFSFIHGDLTTFCRTRDIDFDILIHLASQKIPRYSNSYKTLYDNSKMLENVIDGCLKNKAKLVFASTSDVYGKNIDIPFSEESALVLGNTNVKRWAYAVSKMYSEHYIIANHEEFGLDYTIMRFFSGYGKNQNTTWWGGPQGLFIQNMIEGKSIEIHGTGMQSRCFTYIDDIIDGIMICIFDRRADNDIFNIGSPYSSITISGLANVISDLMDIDPTYVMVPYEDFGKYEDVMARTPDVSKLMALGFNPQYALVDGLKKTIEWQINKHNNG